jgi:hypothetical protein
MKKKITRQALLPALLSCLLLALYAFSSKPGGEGFEVFRNNQLLLQQFGNDMKNIRTLELDKISPEDQLTVRYYHCGKIDKDRHLVIRSKENKDLRNWQFANAVKDKGMSFHPAELLPGKANGKTATVMIYYRSAEIPQERLLFSIRMNG